MENKEKYKYLKAMFAEIRPNKKVKSSIVEFIVAIVIGVCLGIWISFNNNVAGTFKASVELINNIMIAFIAMEMGAYGLFQALLSSELVYTLYKHKKEMLKDYNRSFLGVILLFWSCIMINILLLIIIGSIQNDWYLTSSSMINSVICAVFLTFYYAFNFRVMFEVRNYAINLYGVFEAHNLVMLIKGVTEHENEEKEESQDE